MGIKEIKKEIEQKISENKKQRHQNEVMSLVISKLENIEKSIKDIPKPLEKINIGNFPSQKEEIKISNFPVQKEYPKSIKVTNLSDIKIPEQKEIKEIEIKKPKWFSLDAITNSLKEIKQKAINLNDLLSLLNKLKNKSNAIAVKLVTEDGRSFYNAAFSGSGGNTNKDLIQNLLSGDDKIRIVDDLGNNIGGKFYDVGSNTYKGVLFNAEAPQVCSQDYLLAMSEGDIEGHTGFAKFGRVANVNNSLVDVWPGEGGTPSIYVFPPSAIQMHVVSSSTNDDLGGTGAEKIMIIGLDSNYQEISEEVTMDGTTIVTTIKSFLRINSCFITQAGSSGSAVGNITIKNIDNTITYSQISAGLSTCRQMIYTVPSGKTLYLTSATLASGAGGNALKLNAIIATPKIRTFGSTVFIPQGEFLTINGDMVRILEVPLKILEKSDLKVSVQGDYSAGGTLCTAAVRGWIE